MAKTSICLSEIALSRLQEMARWAGVSVQEALEHAINDQYDRKFWEAVNAGYAALRADAATWAELQAERKLWDRTLLDGLDPTERWTEDGSLAPPTEQKGTS
jgi:hypothetical protein